MNHISNPCPTLIVRTDASSEIGVGHFMRTLALSQKWIERGGNVHYVSTSMPKGLRERLEIEKIGYSPIRETRGSSADALATKQIADSSDADWIIIDGYCFDHEYQSSLRSQDQKLLVLDDYADGRPSNADIVLNQNTYAKDGVYSLLNKKCDCLLGPEFALLRKEFTGIPATRPTVIPAKNVLLTLGGGDPDNITGILLDKFNKITDVELCLKVVIGAANKNVFALEDVSKKSMHKVQMINTTTGMRRLYEWADAVVSAAGSTCLEWLFMQRPAAFLTIADNQKKVAKDLATKELGFDLGCAQQIHQDSTIEILRQLIFSDYKPSKLRIVDGFGADRVCSRLDNGLWIRDAEAPDCQQYFDWVNEKKVRENSLIADQRIEWDGHKRWFENRLKSKHSKMFVCMENEMPVGQIRFDLNNDRFWEVDISIGRKYRGRSLAAKLIHLAVEKMGNNHQYSFIANIKSENIPSLKSFLTNGFEQRFVNGNIIQLKRQK